MCSSPAPNCKNKHMFVLVPPHLGRTGPFILIMIHINKMYGVLRRPTGFIQDGTRGTMIGWVWCRLTDSPGSVLTVHDTLGTIRLGNQGSPGSNFASHSNAAGRADHASWAYTIFHDLSSGSSSFGEGSLRWCLCQQRPQRKCVNA